ncbi:MAG TPA: hypothetical protein P5140_07645 [Methanofastidiosum sp.]|nr:hypothetical protein [Methanofastidiosum sp.]
MLLFLGIFSVVLIVEFALVLSKVVKLDIFEIEFLVVIFAGLGIILTIMTVYYLNHYISDDTNYEPIYSVEYKLRDTNHIALFRQDPYSTLFSVYDAQIPYGNMYIGKLEDIPFIIENEAGEQYLSLTIRKLNRTKLLNNPLIFSFLISQDGGQKDIKYDIKIIVK